MAANFNQLGTAVLMVTAIVIIITLVVTAIILNSLWNTLTKGLQPQQHLSNDQQNQSK